MALDLVVGDMEALPRDRTMLLKMVLCTIATGATILRQNLYLQFWLTTFNIHYQEPPSLCSKYSKDYYATQASVWVRDISPYDPGFGELSDQFLHTRKATFEGYSYFSVGVRKTVRRRNFTHL